MNKAEMETHHWTYTSWMDKATSAERDGLYRAAVEAALTACDSIDGMMQYARKYEKREFASVSAFDVILKYAPYLFDFQSLNKLEHLLENYKRIERNTSADMAEMLDVARARMWDNHRLWDHLERNPDTRQDDLRKVLGGNQEHWQSVAEMWERMGLLRRTPEAGSYRLLLATRMDELMSAKCPSCGNAAEAPKAMFLETMACPNCRLPVLFVFLASEPNSQRKE